MSTSEFWFQTSGGSWDPTMVGASLRFRDNNASYLSQAPRGADSSRKWTWSGWLKFAYNATPDPQNYVIGASSFNNLCQGILIDMDSRWRGSLAVPFNVGINGEGFNNHSSQFMTDPHGWFHMVTRWDGTGNANSIRMWINNEEISWTQTKSGWYDMINRLSVTRMIGCTYSNNPTSNFRGSMAELHFVDNQVLDPSTFAEYAPSGHWVPKTPGKMVADYGTNGYYLDFKDPGAIGRDVSGRNNNFTPHGFELSNVNSTNYDWSNDSPTNNHITWSPLYPDNDMSPYFENANYKSGNDGFGIGMAKGKWYFEGTCYNTYGSLGVASTNTADYTSSTPRGQQVVYRSNGSILNNNSAAGYGASWASGDVIGCAVDTSSGRIEFFKNGVSQGVARTDVNDSRSPDGWKPKNRMMVLNMGQKSFKYSPPSGYLAPCTGNFPAPSLPAAVSGTFQGNSRNNDGPYIYTGFLPGRVRYGSVNVTYGNRKNQSDVDFLCNGFRVRTTNSNSGTVSYTADSTHTDGPYNGKQIPFGGAGVPPAPASFN